MKKVLVFGGGVGGLSVAWMLARSGKFEVTVVEKEANIGGLCATLKYKDFSLDYGAHKAYSVIPGILDEIMLLLGEEKIKHEKKNSIYLFGSFLKYPFSLTNLVLKMGLKNFLGCCMALMESVAGKMRRKRQLNTYEDFVVDKFGRRLYELTFRPLAEKVWGNPGTLSVDIAQTRIPSASIFDVLIRILGIKKENVNTDAKYFYYPKGGFGRIPERMAEEIIKAGGKVLVNTSAKKVIFSGNHIEKVILESKGKEEMASPDYVISTIPINGLLEIFSASCDIIRKPAVELAKKLEYRSLVLVYVFLNKEKIINDHWIFFPDSNLIFSRIFEQKNMDAQMVPKNKTVICCDFTDYKNGSLYLEQDDKLADRCINDLEKIGLISRGDVEDVLVKRFPDFYPRYGVGYKENLKALCEELAQIDNLLLSGRVGFYNYNNADHCLDMGRFIAERLSQDKPPKDIFRELQERVSGYRIVD